jgi:phosphatidylserine decarboxylase
MRIHREGTKIIIVIWGLVLLVLLMINGFFPEQTFIHYFLYGLAILFMVAVMLFFRYTNRLGEVDETLIMCPADGTVIQIREVFEDEYFKDKRLLVSIFMSIVNIHVNWFPVNGTIRYIRYHPGKFLLAFLPKSSKLNEHNSIVIETPGGPPVLVRQIAGGVARRIVCYPSEGDSVKQGQQIGIIKFGSRVELFLPLYTELFVKEKQKVKAGLTRIGRFTQPSKKIQ